MRVMQKQSIADGHARGHGDLQLSREADGHDSTEIIWKDMLSAFT